jgi:glycosyltransferase involved in cell wall biosynthesis
MGNSRKRIALDVRLLARGPASGIPGYTRNLIGSILENHPENHYKFFYTGLRKKPLPKSWTQRPNISIVDIKAPNKLLDLSSRLLEAPNFDKKLDVDVIFSPHFNVLSLKKTPRIITFHDLSFVHHPHFFSFKQRFWHWLQDYKRQAKKATAIIAMSEFTKSDLVNLIGVDPNKVKVIYSGIDKQFRILSQAECDSFKKKNKLSFPIILYLGTLEPRKNVEAVIRAFTIVKNNSAFKDFRLLIAGRPGWLYKNILRTAKQSPHSRDIIFWKNLSDEDRVFLYNVANLFVFPSFFEGFGFPPLEAQACGTPVVMSERTSLLETINDTALKINPWQVAELAHKVEHILTRKQERESLIKKGLENAKSFTWQKTAQETLKILENA